MKKYKIDQEKLIADDKAEIIRHLNLDHSHELVLITKTFGNLANLEKIKTAKLIEIEEEFCKILVEFENESQKEVAIKYTAKGDYTEKLLFLAYEAMIKNKQMLMPSKSGKTQYFEFISKEMIGKNFVRLHLKSYEPLNENYAGLAYSFKLQNLQTIPKYALKAKKTKDNMSFFQQKLMTLLLFVTKKLSTQKRRAIVKKMMKGRYYTVRQIAKSSEDQSFYDLNWIDVYLHNNSPGSVWAKNSKKGDILISQREHPEKFATMQEDGKILLIADETSYPAVAGFLENWKSAQAPVVFLLANKDNDKRYFNDCKMIENTKIEWIVCDYEEQVQNTLAKIDEYSSQKFSLVWAALEAEIAKQIRVFLRTELNMPNDKTIVKGYWTKE